jgi:hypothetical protein
MGGCNFTQINLKFLHRLNPNERLSCSTRVCGQQETGTMELAVRNILYMLRHCWQSRSPLALSIFFPLLLWRFLSSQLFCVHYTIGCVRHVALMEEIRNEYKILVGKPEGKRQLGCLWSRWKYNIKRALKTSCDWILPGQAMEHRLALINTVMNIRIL